MNETRLEREITSDLVRLFDLDCRLAVNRDLGSLILRIDLGGTTASNSEEAWNLHPRSKGTYLHDDPLIQRLGRGLHA